jgi:hypothetical protein
LQAPACPVAKVHKVWWISQDEVSWVINCNGPTDVFNVQATFGWEISNPGVCNVFSRILVDGNVNAPYGGGLSSFTSSGAEGAVCATSHTTLGSVTGLTAGQHTITIYAQTATPQMAPQFYESTYWTGLLQWIH